MFCGKAAIVVTEMARNIFLHGKGGEIVIREVATAPMRPKPRRQSNKP